MARLDEAAAAVGTSRSDLLRRGAITVLESQEVQAADEQLHEAYRREPQDPAVVESALRMARRSTSEG